MALALGKQIFNPAGEILANYDFTDIAAGTGFEVFYGATTYSGSGGISYTLTPNQIYSDRISTSGARINIISSGSAFFKTIDNKNFDVTFNLPRIISGDAIITIPVGANSFSAPTNPGIAFAEIEIRKVDVNNNETIMYSKVSGSITTSAIGIFKSHLSVFKTPLKNTHFGKDEKLRLNVSVWNRGDGDVVQAFLGHDPKDRIEDDVNWASGAPVMTVNIPFKIDI